MIVLRVLLALFALVVLPTRTVGARFPNTPCSWVASRTLDPYTGRAPLQTVRFTLDVSADWALAYENRADSIQQCSFANLAIRVECSLDPAFGSSIASLVVVHSGSVTFVEPPFDGLVDFSGSSGVSLTVTDGSSIVVDLPVADETPWRSPYVLHVRASAVPSAAIAGTGPFIATADPFARANVTATYNP